MRKSLLLTVAIFTLCSGLIAGCSQESSTVVMNNTQVYTAYRVLRSQPQFSTFVKLLKAARLRFALQTAGNYTVFAPTNAAFADLPAGTVKNLERSVNRNELRHILWYHIASVQITPAAAAASPVHRMTDRQNAMIKAEGGHIVSIDNAAVVVGPQYAENGVIYGIDHVIMPAK